MGGSPTELSCSGSEVRFKIQGSDIDSTHREVILTRNSNGEIQTAHITEYLGAQRLQQGQVELTNMNITSVTPQLGNHRNLAPFNRSHTDEDFRSLVSEEHPKGVMAFLQKMGDFDLYLNLVLDQLNCDCETTAEAQTPANLPNIGVQ